MTSNSQQSHRRLKLSLIVSAGLFGCAVLFQVLAPKPAADTDSNWQPLAQTIPLKLGGVVGHDEPIATSEEMKKAVSELLNYDDAVYRIYQLPGNRISVYIAWWKAGKMSPRLVAGHTPDVCWPGNGWSRDLAAENVHEVINPLLISDGLIPGEQRVFRANGRPEYVVFWHLVGTESISYKTGRQPPWWAFFSEIWGNGLNLKKEQRFVRISSDAPLESFWTKEEIKPLAEMLRQTGLAGSK